MEEQVLNLRQASIDDIPLIQKLFRETITHINNRDYTSEQISAWINRGENDEKWRSRIINQHFIVAESESELLGFASINNKGYLDVLFVSCFHQNQGIASALLKTMEVYALDSKYKIISTDASVTALPFFLKKGYRMVKEQYVDIGIVLINYKMIKHLIP